MNATQANVRCHVVPPNSNRTRGTKDMYLEVAVGTGAGFARVDKGDAAWRGARAGRAVGLVERLVLHPVHGRALVPDEGHSTKAGSACAIVGNAWTVGAWRPADM